MQKFLFVLQHHTIIKEERSDCRLQLRYPSRLACRGDIRPLSSRLHIQKVSHRSFQRIAGYFPSTTFLYTLYMYLCVPYILK